VNKLKDFIIKIERRIRKELGENSRTLTMQ
jgi:hypothetical protein